jgi:hypothetical protein
MSLYYSTHKVFSSKPNYFLHSCTTDSQLTLSIPQSSTANYLFAISSQSSLAELNCVQHSANWIPGWQSFHTNLLVFCLHSPTVNQAHSQLAWDPCNIALGWTQQKTPFPYSPSTVDCVFIAAGTCLVSRCLAMNVQSGSTIPAFKCHVTILNYLVPINNINDSE